MNAFIIITTIVISCISPWLLLEAASDFYPVPEHWKPLALRAGLETGGMLIVPVATEAILGWIP